MPLTEIEKTLALQALAETDEGQIKPQTLQALAFETKAEQKVRLIAAVTAIRDARQTRLDMFDATTAGAKTDLTTNVASLNSLLASITAL